MAVDGARFELGSAAWEDALQQIPEPPPSTFVLSVRLRSTDDERAWLNEGGSGLIVRWSVAWLSRFPRSDTRFIVIDKQAHLIDHTDTAAFPLRPGVHSVYMPTGRAYVGRTAGKLMIESGVIASIEYRFRFPDGYFRLDSLATRRARPPEDA